MTDEAFDGAKLCDIVVDEDDDFEDVRDRAIGTWRHGTEHEKIAKQKSTGKLFRIKYRTTSDGFEGTCGCEEVRAEERIRTVYCAAPWKGPAPKPAERLRLLEDVVRRALAEDRIEHTAIHDDLADLLPLRRGG